MCFKLPGDTPALAHLVIQIFILKGMRAGRGGQTSLIIIQIRNPNNYSKLMIFFKCTVP